MSCFQALDVDCGDVVAVEANVRIEAVSGHVDAECISGFGCVSVETLVVRGKRVVSNRDLSSGIIHQVSLDVNSDVCGVLDVVVIDDERAIPVKVEVGSVACGIELVAGDGERVVVSDRCVDGRESAVGDRIVGDATANRTVRREGANRVESTAPIEVVEGVSVDIYGTRPGSEVVEVDSEGELVCDRAVSYVVIERSINLACL